MEASVKEFLDREAIGVLGTTSAAGGIRQSVVYFVLDGDRVLISTVGDRAKAKDVERTGRASLCVLGHDKPFPSVTVEGPARIVREGIGPPTAALMARITGNPPAEPLDDDTLASVGRVILEVTVERAYGASYL